MPRRGLRFAFGGFAAARSIAAWLRFAAAVMALVHAVVALLAQESHALMKGFFKIGRAHV